MMKSIIAFSVGIFVMCNTALAESYGNAWVSQVVSVYDGDTFRANIHDWPQIVGTNIPIRVAGVDTPEIRGRCAEETALAMKARELAIELLNSGKSIQLLNIKRGKYFRLVADVVIDGRSLSDALIQAGLGRSYSGGIRGGWCHG